MVDIPSSSPSFSHRHTGGTDALIYRGDVSAGGNYAKATATITQGEILKPVTGITGKAARQRGAIPPHCVAKGSVDTSIPS